MGFSREQQYLTDLEVRTGIKCLMPNLSDTNLKKAVRYLQVKGPLTPIKLLEAFEFEDEEGETFDEDWLEIIFKKLAKKDCSEALVHEFEVFFIYL